MTAALKIELVKTIRGKDKATFQGFVYTLTKSSLDVQQWVCENRGTCKARMHTKGDEIIKLTQINDIYSSHTHGSNPIESKCFEVVPEYFFQYTIHAERDGFFYPCVYALLPDKSGSTYNRLLSKLLEIQTQLDPSTIMIDFEKAVINVFEDKFLAVISGCFFHLSQNVYRKIQLEGLTTIYQVNREFLLKLKMLPSLAFVPEQDVMDCFDILMADFPESALGVATNFEDNYNGKRLTNNSRRIPPFPIRIWNMYERVRQQLPRTNNIVEGWHNAFNSNVGCSHPSVSKLFKSLQREQSLQEAKLIKWESGDTIVRSKSPLNEMNVYSYLLEIMRTGI
ncbi:hypothetical protein LOD99_2180 [Oopsacas minuta]|uniref:MULE transposase domain-containing protein n=1 Tax=Oopsacas minuta TaxID=111878 RepID=A0AAV7K436_9METZ|nr:hypothetical protein LOD99_2180 [Oopsacas minuta]